MTGIAESSRRGATGPLTIEVERFRGVERARWRPERLCALVGPNGSGKSSLLSAWLFMHYALKRTVADAIRVTGGQATLRHVPSGSPEVPRDDVRLSLSDDRVRWTIVVATAPDGRALSFDERIAVDGVEQDLRRLSGRGSLGDVESEVRLKTAFNLEDAAGQAIEAFRARARLISVFRPWPIEAFRSRAWSEATDASVRLRHDATNIAAVLSNWKVREHQARLDWVRSTLAEIYPSVLSDVEGRKDGGAIHNVRCYLPGGQDRSLPLYAMSNGVISTLFTLVAVAGAPPGATLLFDEADNSLHPAAVRRLLVAVRARAEAEPLTAVFATHSTVVLDQFNSEPESVWVLRRGEDEAPRRLTDECDADWLQNFRLGAIYGAAFGEQEAPRSAADAAGYDPLSGE